MQRIRTFWLKHLIKPFGLHHNVLSSSERKSFVDQHKYQHNLFQKCKHKFPRNSLARKTSECNSFNVILETKKFLYSYNPLLFQDFVLFFVTKLAFTMAKVGKRILRNKPGNIWRGLPFEGLEADKSGVPRAVTEVLSWRHHGMFQRVITISNSLWKKGKSKR